MRPMLFRVRIVGPSMEPTLVNGQVAWARAGGLRPGRIAVFPEPGRAGLLVVKRLVRMEQGAWWVAGDNVDASTDSRHYGPVEASSILGTVLGRR